MVVPGYDPEDIDDALEHHLSADDIERLLTPAEWDAYQEGEQNLLDLLSGEEIRELLDREDISLPDGE